MKHLFMLAEEAEPGFWEQIGESVKDWWWRVQNAFSKVNPEANGSLSLVVLVIGLCAGLIVAVWCGVIVRRRYGSFVRALLHADADTPETAKTPGELGYGEGLLGARILHGLLHSSDLRRVVSCREEIDFYRQESQNFAASTNGEASSTNGEAASTNGEAGSVPSDTLALSNEPDRDTSTSESVSRETLQAQTAESTEPTAQIDPAISAETVQSDKTSRPGFTDWILSRSEHEFDLKHAITTGQAHYFIAEKNQYLASRRFDAKGERLLPAVLVTILTAIGCLLLLNYLPGILETLLNAGKNIV